MRYRLYSGLRRQVSPLPDGAWAQSCAQGGQARWSGSVCPGLSISSCSAARLRRTVISPLEPLQMAPSSSRKGSIDLAEVIPGPPGLSLFLPRPPGPLKPRHTNPRCRSETRCVTDPHPRLCSTALHSSFSGVSAPLPAAPTLRHSQD